MSKAINVEVISGNIGAILIWYYMYITDFLSAFSHSVTGSMCLNNEQNYCVCKILFYFNSLFNFDAILDQQTIRQHNQPFLGVTNIYAHSSTSNWELEPMNIDAMSTYKSLLRQLPCKIQTHDLWIPKQFYNLSLPCLVIWR